MLTHVTSKTKNPYDMSSPSFRLLNAKVRVLTVDRRYTTGEPSFLILAKGIGSKRTNKFMFPQLTNSQIDILDQMLYDSKDRRFRITYDKQNRLHSIRDEDNNTELNFDWKMNSDLTSDRVDLKNESISDTIQQSPSKLQDFVAEPKLPENLGSLSVDYQTNLMPTHTTIGSVIDYLRIKYHETCKGEPIAYVEPEHSSASSLPCSKVEPFPVNASVKYRLMYNDQRLILIDSITYRSLLAVIYSLETCSICQWSKNINSNEKIELLHPDFNFPILLLK